MVLQVGKAFGFVVSDHKSNCIYKFIESQLIYIYNLLAVDIIAHRAYASPAAPHWAGGFGRPCSKGAKAMRRKSCGFFIASRFMAGGVWGSRKACRTLCPVDQPCTSSAARCLVAPCGGLTAAKELTMNTKDVPVAQSNTEVSGHIVVIDGQPTTTTQDIADVYGKQHAKVLAVVRQRMGEVPDEWRLANFGETVIERPNPSGGAPIKSPVIRMTKKGFHFVVGKFTSMKAVQHQIAFADEFERMESQLQGKATEGTKPLLPTDQFIQK
ncbi:Rha family transcriptional regulator [Methylomicrobium album]|uniref:Rha family transcriptional regulator n=1 Tax=Methylomicrobium TaxID=39773 RepID=UPI000A01E71D